MTSYSMSLSMSDSNVTVAALIPVYRVDDEIFLKALQSMFLQSRPIDQMIVIDDSGEGAYENLVKSAHKNSGALCELVYLRNLTNIGLVSSLNIGLSLCTTDVIARMDADDISLPYRIEAQLEKIMSGYDLVGGSIVKFGRGQLSFVRYPNNFFKIVVSFLRSNPFAHPTVMFRRSKIEALGGYHHIAHAEDLDLWVRCLASNLKMTNITMPLLMYRLHAQQISQIYQVVQKKAARSIRLRVLGALTKRVIDIFLPRRNA